jgi:hypothetical protein
MPDATAAPMIEGQGIPVELRDVEPELAKLWGPAAEQVGGPSCQWSVVSCRRGGALARGVGLRLLSSSS